MIFTLFLGFSAFFVASCAAYFSVLGIATLFSGSYLQVAIMASSLELGKLVATSYLYRYWNKTVWWLKLYMMTAVVVLMAVTSMGIFGYLSAAYQTNSSKFAQIDGQIAIINQQKTNVDNELSQNAKRIETLNELRNTQEQRVQAAGNYKAPREQAYAAIDKANQEIQKLTDRNQALQQQKLEKDNEVLALQKETHSVKDVGTFKFIASALSQPLDTVVIWFIVLLICVFDPLAVSLILALNVALRGSILKEVPLPNPSSNDKELELQQTTEPATEENFSDQATPTTEEHKTDSSILTGIKASARLKQRR